MKIIKRQFIVELTYDQQIMHEDDAEGYEWFENLLRSKHLTLYENNDVEDEIAEVRIIGEMKPLEQSDEA